jgi:uncharacterized membrane protein
MNIHPLFVHFPIALLTIYAMMQLVPLKWKKSFPWWNGAGAFLVTIGWLLTLPSGATGGIAEELVKEKINPALIEMHAMFAGFTIVIFFIFFAGEMVRVFKERGWGDSIASKNPLFFRVWNFKQKCSHVILDTFLTKVVAVVGLLVLAVTGGLGGAIAYNPEIDPVVSTIYHFFF